MESAFRRPLPDGLRLIETFGWHPGEGFRRLPSHLARLAATAAMLGVPYRRGAIDAMLAAVGGDGTLRVRLSLDAEGRPTVEAGPLAPNRRGWTMALAGERLDPADPWLAVKTSMRERHDRARAALPAGIDEAVFLNHRGEVCEGTITNVFVDRGQGLLTPPRASGLLPGILRMALIEAGAAREAVLWPEDLARGRVYAGNSLRGLIPARLAG